MTQNSACSPGLSRFTTAASRPPVPLQGYSRMSLSVRSAQRSPPMTSSITSANSGPRWLIMGRLAERTTRAGSGVGPGTRSCGSPMRRSLPKAAFRPATTGPEGLSDAREWARLDHNPHVNTEGRLPVAGADLYYDVDGTGPGGGFVHG